MTERYVTAPCGCRLFYVGYETRMRWCAQHEPLVVELAQVMQECDVKVVKQRKLEPKEAK